MYDKKNHNMPKDTNSQIMGDHDINLSMITIDKFRQPRRSKVEEFTLINERILMVGRLF